MTALQQLDKRLVDMSFFMLAGVGVWFITQQMGKKIDTVTKQATQPAGELLSDLTALYNGWEGVELQPLMIRDFYLNDDFTLTEDAKNTLWNVNQYRPLMEEMFGYESAPMKEKYRPLINTSIER